LFDVFLKQKDGQIGMFRGHQLHLVFDEVLANGIFFGHFETNQMGPGDVDDGLAFLLYLKIIL